VWWECFQNFRPLALAKTQRMSCWHKVFDAWIPIIIQKTGRLTHYKTAKLLISVKALHAWSSHLPNLIIEFQPTNVSQAKKCEDKILLSRLRWISSRKKFLGDSNNMNVTVWKVDKCNFSVSSNRLRIWIWWVRCKTGADSHRLRYGM
jgi:hypothetical protein